MLSESRVVRLELPPRDGVYHLWLFHVESPDQEDMRPVFDTQKTESARWIEDCAARLHPEGEEFADGILLCQVNVRMGIMKQASTPVPRAGKQECAAESYLKPQLIKFIQLNKQIISLCFEPKCPEIDLPTLSFNLPDLSLFLLIEEGTTDRVLYRTAGSLVSYAHDYYNALPPNTGFHYSLQEYIRTAGCKNCPQAMKMVPMVP